LNEAGNLLVTESKLSENFHGVFSKLGCGPPERQRFAVE
jgi:hypothetical protein